MRLKVRSVSVSVLTMLFIGIVVACGSIADDELQCEESASKVDVCCEGLNPQRFNCLNDNGCNQTLVPIFTERAFECLQEKSCDDLTSKGSCEVFRQMSLLPTQLQDPVAVEQEACK